jgi:hypothetical protein
MDKVVPIGAYKGVKFCDLPKSNISIQNVKLLMTKLPLFRWQLSEVKVQLEKKMIQCSEMNHLSDLDEFVAANFK